MVVSLIQKIITMSKQQYPTWYRRNLPHWQPKNGVFSVTTRLYGSLPKAATDRLITERAIKKAELLNQGLHPADLKAALRKMHEFYFGVYDDLLDNPTTGPTHLKDPEIAKIITDTFMFFNEERYEMICYTVMSNHIHLIFYKLDRQLTTIMASLKKFSARQANKQLGRINVPFWAVESYDHLILDREELARKIWYFLCNPVKAGLVDHWEDFPYNYLNPKFRKFLPPEAIKNASNSDFQSEQ